MKIIKDKKLIVETKDTWETTALGRRFLNDLLIKYDNNIVFLLFDIFRSVINTVGIDELKPLFVQVELYLLHEDYTPLIEYAMNNNKLNILDKLFKYSSLIYRFALDLYNIPLNTPGVYQTRNGMMSGRKFNELVKWMYK